MRFLRLLAAPVAMSLVAVASIDAQQQDNRSANSAPPPGRPQGWEVAGVPALNFDADEGFGLGAAFELYNYGGLVRPYRLTIQPTVLLTTEGRRDVTVFFDAPAMARRWRVTAFTGSEQQLAQPYYGVGNATAYDPNAERPPNPYFYRFGRERLRLTTDLQHRLGSSAARVLIGGGVTRSTFDLTPHDSGTTLLATQLSDKTPAPERGNYLRVGILWDTRDQEIGPHQGTWAEALVQRVSAGLGATSDFTRWTTTVRQYVPVAGRLTFAQRVIAQGIQGNAPFDELATIQSSYKQQEGLGGSGSIRGIPKDRYIGKSLLLSNSELRWRAADFSLLHRNSFLALSSFVDAGRVWSDQFVLRETFDDLHVGYGGGVRLGLGPSFIVSTDVGHSSESKAAIYVGLGWGY